MKISDMIGLLNQLTDEEKSKELYVFLSEDKCYAAFVTDDNKRPLYKGCMTKIVKVEDLGVKLNIVTDK